MSAPELKIKERNVYRWLQIFPRHLLEPDEVACVSKASMSPSLRMPRKLLLGSWLSCGECNDHLFEGSCPGNTAPSGFGCQTVVSSLFLFLCLQSILLLFSSRNLAAIRHVCFGSATQFAQILLPACLLGLFLIKSRQTG